MSKAFKPALLSTLIALSLPHSSAMAASTFKGDISIYMGVKKFAKPAVLFVLDESASMLKPMVGDEKDQTCDTPTRTDVLRESLINVLTDEDFKDVKVGILGFGTNAIEWMPVAWRNNNCGKFPKNKDRSLKFRMISPFTDLDNVQDSNNLVQIINKEITETVTSYLTPSSKALEAAVEWFKEGYNSSNYTGDLSKAPDQCENGKYEHNYCTKWNNYNYFSVDNNGNYITGPDQKDDSPLKQEDNGDKLFCQSNHIIFMTDGDPYLFGTEWIPDSQGRGTYYYIKSYDKDGDGEAEACDQEILDNIFQGASPRTKRVGAAMCSPEIVEYGYTHDFLPDEEGWLGKQNIKTHTIGFQTRDYTENYLKMLADTGGGDYYYADDSQTLAAAFDNILTKAVSSISLIYNAPEIPVNTDNLATSSNEAFIPLFAPATRSFWKGNLKKYTITYDEASGQIDISFGSTSVLDSKKKFNTSNDMWNNSGCASEDIISPLDCGAASLMTGTRNLYTFLGENTDLTASENRVHPDNDGITQSMLGAQDDSERKELLYWINWKRLEADGTTTDINGIMGAPFHTSPLVIGNNVYLNASDGMLHVFDKDTGTEKWAFMPDELLNYIKPFRANETSIIAPYYGLDGPMTFYEINGKKILVMGMRRGGRNYYALDITDPDSPKFAWEIIGGSGDFAKLGQTWSKPILLKVSAAALNAGSGVIDVLAFGGGYDSNQDNAGVRSDDTMGNAIFFTRPDPTPQQVEDGNLLIKRIDDETVMLDEGEMGNGIVANLVPVDINANGVTDRLYAADVGGRIIRIDLPDSKLAQITGHSELTASVIADVNVGADGGLDNAADTQRFYNPPEVAYFDHGSERFLALLIGSGFRPSPTDMTVTDRFYMIKDPDIWTAPWDPDDDTYGNYDLITEEKLYNTTENIIQDGIDGDCPEENPSIDYSNTTKVRDCAIKQLAKADGWYISLNGHEKVFSQPKVYDYAVLFTTISGDDSTGGICEAEAAATTSYLYVVNMVNGSAMFNTNASQDTVGNAFSSQITPSDGEQHSDDRKINLDLSGMIPPSPKLMFPKYEKKDDQGNVTDVGLGGKVVAITGLKAILDWPDRFHPVSWEEVVPDE